MPGRQEHLDKAAHNERFLDTFDVDSTPYLDWVVIVAFYIALHYIDAYLASRGFENIPDHRTRNNLLILDRSLGSIRDYYYQLKDDSEEARYDVRLFTTQEVNEILNVFLEPVRHHIQQLLGII